MIQLNGRRYDNGEPVCITIVDERIVSVEPAWPDGKAEDWPIIAPGLFDLQINGHGGTWFNKKGLTDDDVMATLEPHFRHGITRMCPTISTAPLDAITSALAAIHHACQREPWVDRMVPGCHLEGPYLSAEDGPRGAHPIECLRPADWDEFCRLQEASGNRICLVTLAPEVDGAIPFIRKASDSGVVVAIGHTGASADQIRAAVDAGARVSTHLGNGAHAMLPRHPNYLWDQLADPRLTATIITDGHHLPPEVVRSIIGIKTPMNTIITCDAAGLAGCPPGRYRLHSTDVEILESGRIVIAGQTQLLVGSSLKTDVCMSNAMAFADLSLRQAIDMASGNTARLLGFEDVLLRRGSLADLILFHHRGQGSQFEIVATVAAGVLRFGEIPREQR